MHNIVGDEEEDSKQARGRLASDEPYGSEDCTHSVVQLGETEDEDVSLSMTPILEEVLLGRTCAQYGCVSLLVCMCELACGQYQGL